ncbi:MAG: outer membrane lipoprotein carrier protein LolA [Bryobacteraceae bacterium]|nr:outer membrane lipoprotein carrier protein LolA [Bryobacteraceae bacterium]
MTLRHPLLWILALWAAQAPASPLEEALARLDRAAAGFRGMKAQIRKVSFTALVKESEEESGRITLFRPKPKDLRMLVEFDQPSPRAVAFANNRIQIFYPRLMTVQEYDLGRQGSLVDQFLLLGFGTPVRDLRRAWSIRHVGQETVNGTPADRLELTPLSQEALQHVKTIEIWVSQADGMVLQQKVNQPSRDYVLVTYSSIQVNPALTPADVRLNLPKGVKKETPQR